MIKKIAITFPGQGSQRLGMLYDYHDSFETVRKVFEEAKEYLGYDLWEIIQHDSEKLNSTEYTQPAILASSYAIWQVLQEKLGDSFQPQYLAGHSLGEYSALLCAGSISFGDALRVVSVRGKLMHTAVDGVECAMSAILGLDNDDVIAVCEEASTAGVVEAANFNSVGQVVISGDKKAVENANAIAKEKGARRAQMLAVSVPSHCSLMRDAAKKLALVLANIDFKKPKIPVLQNVNADFTTDVETIKSLALEQLYKPVLWTQTVEKLESLGIDDIIECGPNKVLSGLNKRISKKMKYFDTATVVALNKI